MIIQCEQCRTKFKLDDAKVKDKGVKVRCAKCRNVFMVFKDQAQEEKPDFSELLDQHTDKTVVGAAPVSFELENEPHAAAASGSVFDTSSFAVDSGIEKNEPSASSPFDFGSHEAAPATPAAEGFDLSSLAWNDGVAATEEPVSAGSGFDFSGIAAEGAAVDADKTVVASSSFVGLDDLSVAAAPELQPKPDLEGFLDSIGTHEPVAAKDAATEQFNMGEIDFGGELATISGDQVNPEKHDADFMFVPLDEKAEKAPEAAAFVSEEPAVPADASKTVEEPAQEELPPLPIASRRKSSSMMTIILAVLGAAAIGLLVFFGMDMSSDDKAKPKVEPAKITLRAVNASFVKNNSAGELLVISGEAVNNYDTPRASIQVKGVVYGAQNSVLSSKNAFAGNPISKEQLASMPMEKIEAAMANQFGDSLANMEIAPGKSIPFVVVISKVPAEAKEFAVELVGSTGAAAKK